MPSALHEDVGLESTIQLKVILDNTDVPDPKTFPKRDVHLKHEQECKG